MTEQETDGMVWSATEVEIGLHEMETEPLSSSVVEISLSNPMPFSPLETSRPPTKKFLVFL